MSSIRYFIFENGRVALEEPANFKLHDSVTEFRATPRVFTTFIAEYQRSAHRLEVRFLEEHLLRLRQNAGALSVGAIPRQQIITDLLGLALRDYFRDNSMLDKCRVRLALSENKLELHFDSFVPRDLGQALSVCSCNAERLLPLLKTTATAASLAAKKHAEEQLFDDALLVNSQGLVSECAWANLFWVNQQGEFHTPLAEVLPGVTAAWVKSQVFVRTTPITIDELINTAAEIFITQSTNGVNAVGAIDSKPIGDGKPGRRTRNFCVQYKKLSGTILAPRNDAILSAV